MAIAELRAQIDGQAISSQQAEMEYPIPVPFIVHVRKLSGYYDNNINTPLYSGQFGFDWMRDEYKKVCFDYEKLKSAYEVLKLDLDGQKIDYYIPWLCIYPEQEKKTGHNVELRLEVLLPKNEKWRKRKIKFDCSSSLKITPGEIELDRSRIEKHINEQQSTDLTAKKDLYTFTIECTAPLSGVTPVNIIAVSDKTHPDEKIVGCFNICANNQTYKLPVKFFFLCDKNDQIKQKQYLNQQLQQVCVDGKTGAEGIVNYLNHHAFNQALIEIESDGNIYDLPIDVADFTAKKALNDLGQAMINVGKAFTGGKFNRVLNTTITNSVYGSSGGVNVVFCAFQSRMSNAGGVATTTPRVDNTCAIFTPSYSLGSLEVFAHEIGHLLDLDHPFDIRSKDDFEFKIKDAQNKIKALEGILSTNRDLLKDVEADKIRIKGYENDKTSAIELLQQSIKHDEEQIEILKSNITQYEDRSYLCKLESYNFEQAETDNIMDYLSKKDEKIASNPNKLTTFWKWQWKNMQQEKFHIKK